MSLEKVMDKWLNDESFRDEIRKDPEAAVQGAGFQLEADERETLQSIDWNQSDEVLQQRISKRVSR